MDEASTGSKKPARTGGRGPWVWVLLICALIVMAMTLLGGYLAITGGYRQHMIFDCLSHGGCWDYQREACEREDQCRCTPERCVRGPDGGLVMPRSARDGDVSTGGNGPGESEVRSIP